LGYRSDAHELVQRALDAGTTIPSIFLTAIDMAQRLGQHEEADRLRERVAGLPDADPVLLIKIADTYVAAYQMPQAIDFLQRALSTQPDSQPLLVRLGELHEQLGQQQQAMQYLDRAVRLGARSAEGKAADQKLATFVPVITDRERGSVILAWREALGIVLFYLVLAWHDAGLHLLHLGIQRWGGVLISMIGAYLLITATSSPQQRGVAEALGGEKPSGKKTQEGEQSQSKPGRALQEPTTLPILSDDARLALGITGMLLLLLAFYMVFHVSIDLVVENPPPYLF
jgi:tetratricopeptide (TPR) repeat protein